MTADPEQDANAAASLGLPVSPPVPELTSCWFTLPGMAGRVRVREIDDDEGTRLMRIVRRGSESVATWRRAQMVLWPAQG